LDIDSLDLVINYHIARDSEVHVHRIGRTGRAGSTGLAYSLYSDKESYKVGLLEDYLEAVITPEQLPSLAVLANERPQAKMATIQIDGGKKQKVRAGDILGALTGDNGVQGSQVGKIKVLDNKAYVAVTKAALNLALRKISKGKMKGRTFNARHLTN
jgi:ATP-independent RNA helicase DbpA